MEYTLTAGTDTYLAMMNIVAKQLQVFENETTEFSFLQATLPIIPMRQKFISYK